ncbi:beta-glucosidase [Microbacterium sp.]|uniref:beta-glucosidase family protein n=1 Tax=Microbacterium sp. TaxID=51671 RepID=UPI00391895D2
MSTSVHPSPTPSDAADRARDLLGRMTLAEKVAQLGSSWPGSESAEGDVAPMQETHLRAEPFADAVVDGLGHLTRVYGTTPVAPVDGRRRLDDLQEAVVAGNRWGIPAIAHEECLTGVTAWGATVYPTPLAWAASFDPETVRRMGERIGGDLRDLGVHQGLAPVLDVVRDYRWGRVEETMGEDPHVVAEIGTAYVAGIEASGTVATPKHFAGYAASRGARNHAPVSIGPREFADVILPPFERALQTARSVMNSYTDIDGVPAAADVRLFTELLRVQWGFEGTVVSDYWAIPFLHSMHRVAADETSAGLLALRAGIDVELPHRMSYLGLVEAVESGVLEESLIDRAAERVIRQKIELNLLDSTDDAPRTAAELDSDANREVARTLAERSIVLLRNEGVLPLAATVDRIAVIGPAADDAACLFGCYSFPNHVLVHHPDTPLGVDAPTYLDALRAHFGGAVVDAVEGTSIRGGDTDGIPAAAEVASRADLAIVIVGDRSGMFGLGTSGEGCDVSTLELPGAQQQLIDAVLDTGTPVVLVINSGRPYALGGAVDRATAIVQVFLPGQEGANALVDVLTGRVNPSGRLPVQIPTLQAPQPGTYLAPPLALRSDGVSNLDPSPAFPFGHGLTYTTFTRAIVDADTVVATSDGEISLAVEVVNTGSRAGADVVQVYASYPAPSVVQPVRRLVGFHRVDVGAGERAVVEFRIPTETLAFTGLDLQRAVEAGTVRLSVAASAADEGLTTEVEVHGDRFVVTPPRRRFTTSAVRAAS